MNKLLSVVIIAIACLSTGCGTMFSGTSDHITFNSVPKGARVYVDGMKVGRTPVTVPVKRSISAPQVRIVKKGYEPSYVVLQNSFNNVALLDIFVWPGFIVDAATGAIMKYSVVQYDSELELAKK